MGVTQLDEVEEMPWEVRELCERRFRTREVECVDQDRAIGGVCLRHDLHGPGQIVGGRPWDELEIERHAGPRTEVTDFLEDLHGLGSVRLGNLGDDVAGPQLFGNLDEAAPSPRRFVPGSVLISSTSSTENAVLVAVP